MFDIDSGKLLIIAVVALIVIGPKELPRVLRQVGQSVGKLRRMAGDFQGQFMDAMKEADIADIRKELDEINRASAMDIHFDPARDIQREMTTVMEPVAAALSTTETPSPAATFEIPKLEAAEDTMVAAGIAPVADEPPPDPQPLASEPPVPAVDPKRKIFVKRRRIGLRASRGTVALTAGPGLPVQRQRYVRAKTLVAEAAEAP